jgi:hypothetical protein
MNPVLGGQTLGHRWSGPCLNRQHNTDTARSSSQTCTWGCVLASRGAPRFLRIADADTYYLVGDINDFWKVQRGPHWPQSHNDVLQKLLRKARKGARVVFVPGNHDDGAVISRPRCVRLHIATT